MVEDTRDSRQAILSIARKYIDLDKISAAITATYIETAVGGGEFEKAKIPSIALWDSSPQIDALGDWIFSIGPWTPGAAETAARFAAENLKARRAVVFHTLEEWGDSLAQYFKKDFEQRGGTVIEIVSLTPDLQDFRTILARIKNLEPDVIYSPISQNLVPFYTQLKQLEMNTPLISSDIIAAEHIKQNPSAFDNLSFPRRRLPSISSRFSDSFRAVCIGSIGKP